MRQTSNGLRLSPSDLSNHLGCSHLTQLDLLVEQGILDPPQWLDPSLKILQQRGLEFEASYLEEILKSGGHVDLPENEEGLSGTDRTRAAMKTGAEYIYQAALEMDHWYGKADFLKKVPGNSELGDWMYAIVDTKLAKDTRAGTIVQLCVYAQAAEKIQGVLPETIVVVSPGEDEFKETPYRTHDFMAYHRLIQKRFEDQVQNTPVTYPEPVPQCDICKWWSLCDKKRRADDHLSLVAGITRSQRTELMSKGIGTLHHLASLPIPLEWKPTRGVKESFEKIREQARIQVESVLKGQLLFEVLPLEPPVFDESVKDVVTKGLFRLPEPSPGDIFLDFEGDPFIGTSGLEYLFGWIELNHDRPTYHHQWAFHPEEEKKAFEDFIDHVFERLEIFPEMHIYHFGHYETTALKRMMGKYASREGEIDWLLRGQRFVDLHGILKQAVRAGVESYSLKNLEPLFKYSRKTDLRIAAVAKRNLEFCLELNLAHEVPEENKHTTVSYNKEDCEAALSLRQWLETIRRDFVTSGKEIPRPDLKDGTARDEKKARDEQLQALYENLVDEMPVDVRDRSPEQQAKWLLANMLEYHWREEKSGWWEYFDLLKRPIDEFEKAKTAIGPLRFHARFEVHENHVVNEYRFDSQDTDIRKGDSLYDQAQRKIGSVTNIDAQAGILTIQQPLQYKDEHPDGLICQPKRYDTTYAKPGAIRHLAEWVAEHGIDENGPYRAVRDMLLQKSPRPDHHQIPVMESETDRAVEWTKRLENSFLAIQGPPGAGKTYTGAQIIIALVKAGKKVGVTANSHKVIDTLLEEVIKQSGTQMDFICGHKVSAKEDITIDKIVPYINNDTPRGHLQKGKVHVLGGTPIMWANQKFFESVDYLIVDEAGQLSLADTVAAGQAAKNIILLGDPQQLKQPQQGSHPEGTEVSALEHILGEHQTIPQEKGIFLGNTHRMHPSLCAYISELFYENKLHAFTGLERQLISGDTKYQGAGLWLEPVEHNGNQNDSVEEVTRIKEIITELCSGHVFWTNKEGKQKTLDHTDVLVIAPYNAQVGKLKEALPAAIQVGTVDKFQGRQAPVVIYSMATSSPEDAPRGMEFLYNPNRLNVAISRAKSAAILVASPKLFNPECRTPDQMRMANGLCRYKERSNNI